MRRILTFSIQLKNQLDYKTELCELFRLLCAVFRNTGINFRNPLPDDDIWACATGFAPEYTYYICIRSLHFARVTGNLR